MEVLKCINDDDDGAARSRRCADDKATVDRKLRRRFARREKRERERNPMSVVPADNRERQ